jgi:hypothetical protein
MESALLKSREIQAKHCSAIKIHSARSRARADDGGDALISHKASFLICSGAKPRRGTISTTMKSSVSAIAVRQERERERERERMRAISFGGSRSPVTRTMSRTRPDVSYTRGQGAVEGGW